MQKKYSDIMQKWMKEPDYYKETLKKYYKQFNIDISKPMVVNVVMNSDFDFGARRQIDKIEFDSLAKEFKENQSEGNKNQFERIKNQFEGIRFDSGPLADKIFFFGSNK